MDNLESLMECTDEGNVGGYLSRLSQPCDCSTCTVKCYNSRRTEKVCSEQTACLKSNEIQQPPTGWSKKSTNSITKLKCASYEAGTFEEMYDEQTMIQKTTLEGCQQIRNIIDRNMSPPFVGLYKICFELEQTISEPKHLQSESIQNDLMKGFLRLAYCWVNLSSYFGMSPNKFKNLDTTRADVTQSFRNWTCVSQKLMEDLIKIFGHEINAESLQTIMDSEEINKTKADNNQTTGFKNHGFTSHTKHPCNVTQSGNSCPFTTPLKDMCCINTTDRNNSLVVYASTTQDVISVHHSTSGYNVGSNTKNSLYVQNNSVTMHRNYNQNCGNIGFPDMKLENMGSQNLAGMPKGKRSLQYPKDNSTRKTKASSITVASFRSTNPDTDYSERTHDNTRRPDNDGRPSSKMSQNYSHVPRRRFNGHHIGKGFKQITNVSGKMSYPTLINRQKNLSSTAPDTLEFSKHRQQQQVEATDIQQESPNHEVYVENISKGEVGSVLQSKATSLGQAGTCSRTHSPSQVNVFSGFQNLGDCLHASANNPKLTSFQYFPEMLHPDERSYSSTINTVSLITKSNVNNPETPQAAPGMTVLSPTAHTVPPSSCSAETGPRNVRYIHVTKPQESKVQSAPSVALNSDSSDISDLIWKVACGPDGTPLETLQGNKQYSKSSIEGNVETEVQIMMDKECMVKNRSGSTKEIIKSNRKAYGKNKESHCIKSTATAEIRQKRNILKTDDWQVSTLKNVSELHDDAERKFTGKEEVTFSFTHTKSPTSNKPEGTSNTENYDNSETTTNPYQQRSAASKNVHVKQKQGGKKEEGKFFLRSTKQVSGITGKKAHSQHQDFGRSNSDSRNRKLQERSPTEEHQAMQTKNHGSMMVYGGMFIHQQGQAHLPNKSKPKNDIQNKATGNISYSTRHGRGLTSVTVNKSEHILNVVWNMEASDFVKYPVSSSELEDYSKCVKYPTCLEAIGYKLRNRIYETIEQFVHDFRSMLLNAKLYNKDNPVNLQLTDILEKKFNRLLQDHFPCWNFEHITGEQSETKSTPELQYTAFGETSTSSKNRFTKPLSN